MSAFYFLLTFTLIPPFIFSCPDEINCRSCLPLNKLTLGRCAECEHSFLSPINFKCDFDIPDKIDDCLAYEKTKQETLICRICRFGYFFDSKTNKCLKCKIEYCAFCKSEDTCLACFEKRILNKQNNVCEFLDVCKNTNCRICQRSNRMETCLLCDNGYSFVSRDKPECVFSFPNCQQIDPINNQRCLVCAIGHYITERGTCLNNEYARGFALIIPVVGSVLFIVLWYIFSKKLGEDESKKMPAALKSECKNLRE